MLKLEELNFDNSFARLPKSFHSFQHPTSLPAPYLISFNQRAANLIDLDAQEKSHDLFADYFIGNRLLPGADPLSMSYAGHQFGQFVPQLGDGRAILLGEIMNRSGERWDLQLKGAGPTPYSRQGDGRSVLRSCIREYLCSEAMNSLGIPTSRALCIVGSDDEVYRERIESAAVLTRICPSHVRFGSFELFFYRGQHEQIQLLADYVITRHFPDLANDKDKYVLFFKEVILRTAKLMALWQAFGFSHGVMNTDNMSILGLTFDYGPYGFMESYDPCYVCNHSDHHGRYAFDQQPQVGLWNLTCLAQSLSPLITDVQLPSLLEDYTPAYFYHYQKLMVAKLGLTRVEPEDDQLIGSLLRIMHKDQVDYTNFFRSLGKFDSSQGASNVYLREQFMSRIEFDAWAEIYRERLKLEPGSDNQRKLRMDSVNPKYILRNYLAQIAIEKAERQRDFSEIERLLELLANPFDEQPLMESYAAKPPEWSKGIVVSCSS